MNTIKILGASGSKTKYDGTTSFQINRNIVIDAGNIIRTLGANALHVDHIFLTHSHADHITDLPFLIETFFEKRTKPLKIYGLKQTIEVLKTHVFNNTVWPDFSQIHLLNSKVMSLEFHCIKPDETLDFDTVSIKPIIANHIQGACGYVVTKNNLSCLISGDTYKNEYLWKELNENKNIQTLIIECSFPSSFDKLALESKHLTPKLLKEELACLQRNDVETFLYHCKPSYEKQILKELNEYDILSKKGAILHQNDILDLKTNKIKHAMINQDKFERIIDINLALSNELNKDKLFEMILTLTRQLTHADAGTLYIMSSDRKALDFKVVQNDHLNIHMGGTKEPLSWDSLPLYLEDGKENLNMVAAMSALHNKTINIQDVYHDNEYNFEGTKAFDKNTGYRSKSMLVIPLINHEESVIGVLQLINKSQLGEIIAFDKEDERILTALAAQAAMALTNSLLINSLEDFIKAFISMIGRAIDAKSPHTKNHIGKVARIAELLAHAIHEDKTIYKNVNYSANDFRQIEIAAWMHDVGKISMKESIIDKATKLQTLFDRIEWVNERFEVLKRDCKIDYLEGKLSQKEYTTQLEKLEEDKYFINSANVGEEYMDDSKLEHIQRIAAYTYEKNGKKVPFLNEDEVMNLSIRKGTLSDDEKRQMNNHAQLSLDMLQELPFPKKYSRVLDIAANHHEKLNGKGYPRGLNAQQITLEDKIMILADIFEALTAADRPYKEGKKLSEVFKILSFMVKDGEIDGELIAFFHEHDVLKQYAKEFLKSGQIDESKLLF
jgi:HD-GYP domain-containing protein (c-di-GMP phosphodiesterase class II)/ribonuclease BN (tRNA processing enzyme)